MHQRLDLTKELMSPNPLPVALASFTQRASLFAQSA
jgi:hypothetical protein